MPDYETLKKKIIEKETSRQTIDVQFDNELLKIDHYKIHPNMVKYIGFNRRKNGKNEYAKRQTSCSGDML